MSDEARVKELKRRIADEARSQFGPSGTDIWELIEHFENANARLIEAKRLAEAQAAGMRAVVEAARIWRDANQALYAAAVRGDDEGADKLDSEVTDAEEAIGQALSALPS